MKPYHSATDNISEVLNKIIEFTEIRRQIISRNISCLSDPDYKPSDLDADEFSQLMDDAIEEHIINNRLLLRDTPRVKFGENGTFMVKAVPDHHADRLRRKNPSEYLSLQKDKMHENSLNQKVAAELLSRKHSLRSAARRYP